MLFINTDYKKFTFNDGRSEKILNDGEVLSFLSTPIHLTGRNIFNLRLLREVLCFYPSLKMVLPIIDDFMEVSKDIKVKLNIVGGKDFTGRKVIPLKQKEKEKDYFNSLSIFKSLRVITRDKNEVGIYYKGANRRKDIERITDVLIEITGTKTNNPESYSLNFFDLEDVYFLPINIKNDVFIEIKFNEHNSFEMNESTITLMELLENIFLNISFISDERTDSIISVIEKMLRDETLSFEKININNLLNAVPEDNKKDDFHS